MLISALELCGRRGRVLLPLGLLAGFAMPWAAQPVRQLIPLCIFVLLTLATLRQLRVIGALNNERVDVVGRALTDSVRILRHGMFAGRAFRASILGWVLLSQCLLPIGLFLFAWWLHWESEWLLPLILVATASPIAGSPSLVAMLGGDDSKALRWLLLGSALLPCTALPVFYLLFQHADPWQLVRPSLLLLCLIGGALVCAVILHVVLMRIGRPVSTLTIDGGSSLALAVMVIGLMSPVHDPGQSMQTLVQTLFLACAVNFGLQLTGYCLGRLCRQNPETVVATAVVFGNRNIALFLAALPAGISDDLLLFIACYQIPMYLTPLLGRTLLGRIA